MHEGTHRRECREWLHMSVLLGTWRKQLPVLPVMAMVLWAALVTVLYQALQGYEYPSGHWVPVVLRGMSLDSSTNSFLALSLMLVLTMRINQCYNRWWEGRTLWGAIVNRSRNLATQARLWVCDSDLQAGITRYTVAFVYATKRQLRCELGLPELRDDKLVPFQVRLFESEIEEIEMSAHMPVHSLSVLRGFISQAYARKLISDMQLKAMDEDITSLTDSLGGCERIQKTPFPISYVSHARTFTLVYLFFLPMTLIEKNGWSTIMVCFLVCIALMGVEHMSAEIEQPFGHDLNDLKLDAICATIHTNLAQISGFRQPCPVDSAENSPEVVTSSYVETSGTPFIGMV